MGQKALKGTSPRLGSLWQLSSRCLEQGPCPGDALSCGHAWGVALVDRSPAVPPGVMPFSQVGLLSSAGPYMFQLRY